MGRTTGSLRRRIALDEPGLIDDDHGGVEQGWNERFQRSAEVIYLRGGETVKAARLTGQQPAVFRVRSDTSTRAITTDWRLRDVRRVQLGDDGKPVGNTGLYNIKSVIETEDRAWVEITAISGEAI